MTVSLQFGTVGFGYSEWLGSFFPRGMASSSFLSFYSQYFDTAELDSTFYGIPLESAVEGWKAKTPPQFTFCPKTPRDISHAHLPSTIESMLQFVGRMQPLEQKLGAILIQFPSSFQFEHQWDDLSAFLARLPSGVRFAVEFRSPTWRRGRVLQLFRQLNIAWVCVDSVYMPKELFLTADFTYLRFIGEHGRFKQKDIERLDQTESLQVWHQKLSPHLSELNTVYGYFNNDFSGHSPATCNRFKTLFGLNGDYPTHFVQRPLL